MKKSIAVKQKKRGRGRPATGRDRFYGVRVPDEIMARVDEWAKEHDTRSRSEAIRRLLELGLGAPQATVPTSTRKAQKASELADRTAERLVDKSMPPEEQQRRKRALIKGPKEFRDIREDLSKTKR
jgi:Arc/MetJ-type ribon-helix-helix transcriptional regulator